MRQNGNDRTLANAAARASSRSEFRRFGSGLLTTPRSTTRRPGDRGGAISAKHRAGHGLRQIVQAGQTRPQADYRWVQTDRPWVKDGRGEQNL